MMMRSSVFAALFCCAAATMAGASAQTTAPAGAVAASSAQPGPVTDNLVVTDVKVGTGKEAMTGATVSVNYTSWLYRPLARNWHGKQFDTSVGRGPFEFSLGRGMVIKGWDQGVLGMKVGGKRTLIIPAYLAYGSKSAGEIPPNSALIFEVELLDVK